MVTSHRDARRGSSAFTPPGAAAGTVTAVCLQAPGVPGVAKHHAARARLVAGHGVEGDRHAGRDPDRALSLVLQADLDHLAGLGFSLAPGALGENLVIEGLTAGDVPPGARLRAGDTVIEVTGVRTPCVDLESVAPGLLRAAVNRSGWFARVLAGGELTPGSTVTRIGGAGA